MTITLAIFIKLLVEERGKYHYSLEKDGVIIEGNDNLLKHATEYYTDLFCPENDHDLHIEQSVWDELPKVSEFENEDLCKPFSELEIKEASFQMGKKQSW